MAHYTEYLGFLLLQLQRSVLAVGTVFEFIIFVSGLITQWASSKFNKNPERNLEGGMFRRNFDKGFDWFRDHPFNSLVTAAYDFRYVTISIAISTVLIIVVGLLMGGKVGFVFFPSA